MNESAAKDQGLHRHLPDAIGIREFVVLMASLMAMSALSIDPMLPALPAIGVDLHVAHANERQAVITAFFLGLAAGSIFYGPLSDHYGRKPILLGAMACLFAATLACALAPSFPILLAGRLTAGFCAAACRVLVVSIVRDCYQGDMMARIMSLIMFMFMVVPILAPSVGALILIVAPWRWIFGVLAVLVGALGLWLAFRMPETLDSEHRGRFRLRDLANTFMTIITHRSSIGYMIASGFMMGSLVGFLLSVQQIFFDVFHVPDMLPFGFAAIAAGTAIGNLGNSQLVQRFGGRRISQGAVIALIVLSAAHCAVVLSDRETVLLFILIQAGTTMCFSLAAANFSAIALEPFARGAGLASSIQASLTTFMSSLLGAAIGASFNGTTLPIAIGFMSLGGSALVVIAWAERGRLFTRPGLAHLRAGREAPPTAA